MERLLGVIDYGLGNLRSVTKALEFLGARVILSSKREELVPCRGLILPGVGAFRRGIQNLERLGLKSFIIESVERGVSFLGICLGFQLLFTESEEHIETEGLNIIKGRVKKFPTSVKVPHMGWNQVKYQAPSIKSQISKLFEDIPQEAFFYFVHSYYVEAEEEVIVGTTQYGIEFASVVNKGNIWAVQFHPEKSGKLGLRFLKNFIENVS